MRARRGLVAAVAAATMGLSLAVVVAPAGALSASTTTVTDNAGSISTGGTLVFTATVTGAGGTPAGTIAWGGASTCTSSTTTLTAGVATCSIANAQASSSYSVTATFTDTDGNYSGSSGNDGPVSPGKAASTTTVTDNAGSISTGGTLVFTATVTGAGGTPAGTIAWGGASTCTSSTTTLTAGVATCSIANAQASSSYSVTATFSDTDGNYSGSSGNDGPVSPGKAASTTTVTDNAGSISTGGTLVFTATVTGAGGTPAGTIAWGGASTCTSSTTTLTAGVAICSIANAQASSSYSVTATFSDTDGNYSGSSGNDGPVSPGKAASTTTVTDNAGSISTGGTLVFTATVTGAGGTPAGTIAWGGASTCTSSTTTLTAGVATCSIANAQASSSYSVTATFTDTDGNYSGSSGNDGPVSPGKAASTTTVTDNAGSISTGGTLVFTATVTGAGGTPAGTIAWGGASTCTSSTTTLTAGVAICSITNAQASSSYSVTATFSDTDGNYSGSNGNDGPVSPGKADQVTLIVTSTTGTFATPLILTTSGGSGNGSVSYTVVSGTASDCAISSGQLSSSSMGTCLVTATKAADGNYNSISSSQTTITLAPASSTTTVTDNAALVVTGDTLVFTATVTGLGGNPAGTVQWTGVTCSSTTPLDAENQATCSITKAKASITYEATAQFTDDDHNYDDSSGSGSAIVGKALPTTPAIANLPMSAAFGGGFTATVTTTGDGTTSVTSNTPGVCTASGLAVTYVGVGTCSLTAGVAEGLDYLANSGAPQTFTVGARPRPCPPSPTSRHPPTSSSASRRSSTGAATERRRSRPTRRACAASGRTASRSPSWASGHAR